MKQYEKRACIGRRRKVDMAQSSTSAKGITLIRAVQGEPRRQPQPWGSFQAPYT